MDVHEQERRALLADAYSRASQGQEEESEDMEEVTEALEELARCMAEFKELTKSQKEKIKRYQDCAFSCRVAQSRSLHCAQICALCAHICDCTCVSNSEFRGDEILDEVMDTVAENIPGLPPLYLCVLPTSRCTLQQRARCGRAHKSTHSPARQAESEAQSSTLNPLSTLKPNSINAPINAVRNTLREFGAQQPWHKRGRRWTRSCKCLGPQIARKYVVRYSMRLSNFGLDGINRI